MKQQVKEYLSTTYATKQVLFIMPFLCTVWFFFCTNWSTSCTNDSSLHFYVCLSNAPRLSRSSFSPFRPQTVHAVAGLVPPSPPANMGPTGGSAPAPQSLHSPHMRTEQLMSGNSAPNSPMAMLNIGSSHETEVGACEFVSDARINVEPININPCSCCKCSLQDPDLPNNRKALWLNYVPI